MHYDAMPYVKYTFFSCSFLRGTWMQIGRPVYFSRGLRKTIRRDYVGICTYIHTYPHMCVCIYIYKYMYNYPSIYLSIHPSTHPPIHTYIYLYSRTCSQSNQPGWLINSLFPREAVCRTRIKMVGRHWLQILEPSTYLAVQTCPLSFEQFSNIGVGWCR